MSGSDDDAPEAPQGETPVALDERITLAREHAHAVTYPASGPSYLMDIIQRNPTLARHSSEVMAACERGGVKDAEDLYAMHPEDLRAMGLSVVAARHLYNALHQSSPPPPPTEVMRHEINAVYGDALG